ncbi:MAG: enoyl-CoA hydratase-related protein [Paenibacillaceae bacterium]
MEKLKISVDNKVQTIVIDNPPANSLDSQTIRELEQVLVAAENDSGIKAIIITGVGKFFIAGADIHAFATIDKKEPAKQFSEQGQRFMDRIESLSKPVIAQINGYCLGGGLELAMACHVRVASETARLGLPELHLGIIPGYGGSQRLPRLTNQGKATELILTGEMIDGREALNIGLVSKAVPSDELGEVVRQLAGKMVDKSLPAIAAALKVLRQGLKEGMRVGLASEADAFGQRFESEDAKEGIQAFIEKRVPDFKDR